MKESNLLGHDGFRPSPTLRDFLVVGFRRRRLIAISFLGIFLGALLCAVLLPEQYQAHMKIFVKRERVDPVVTTEPNVLPQAAREPVSEEDLNSEVELLKSEDLLEQVVVTCGLSNRSPSLWSRLFPQGAGGDDLSVARAVRGLAKTLKVELLPKSSIIEVTYISSDPKLAAQVLSTLLNDYFAKHLTVHRPPGAFEFFEQQTTQYQKELATAEAKLARFSQEQSAVSTPLGRDIALQKWSDFDATLQQTRAAMAETQERIRAIQAEEAKLSPRLTTTNRAADNAPLMEQLKGTLLNLELKRSDLKSKFAPNYPPVQEVEQEIALTRAAIAAEERSPIREETTDRNPAYQWLDGELAKANVDLASLHTRAAATERIVRDYRDRSLLLDRTEVQQQDLMRAAKVEEANYLLYLNKREEARISDALDSKRILNVALAERPTVPVLPVHSRWQLVLLGGVFGVIVSAGSAIASEYLDRSFRTAEEVQESLKIPVLAAMPELGRNGLENGKGNGEWS